MYNIMVYHYTKYHMSIYRTDICLNFSERIKDPPVNVYCDGIMLSEHSCLTLTAWNPALIVTPDPVYQGLQLASDVAEAVVLEVYYACQ